MRIARTPAAGRAFAGLLILCGLGACATADPVMTYRVAGHAEAARPVTVAVVPDMTEEDGAQINQWGGVIPDAKPTTDVEDGGLGDERRRWPEVARGGDPCEEEDLWHRRVGR